MENVCYVCCERKLWFEHPYRPYRETKEHRNQWLLQHGNGDLLHNKRLFGTTFICFWFELGFILFNPSNASLCAHILAHEEASIDHVVSVDRSVVGLSTHADANTTSEAFRPPFAMSSPTQRHPLFSSTSLGHFWTVLLDPQKDGQADPQTVLWGGWSVGFVSGVPGVRLL